MTKFAWMGDVVIGVVNLVLLLSVSTFPVSLCKSSPGREECSFVYDSATELRFESGRGHRITEELSFVNGDWVQDVGNAPILPFDDRGILANASVPLQLASFWVTDVDRFRGSERSLSVKGLLMMGITTAGSFSDRSYIGTQGRQFDVWPGHTRLSISFEGIYVESSGDGGERVLCLLGSTKLPSRQSESQPWLWVKDPRYNHDQSPLLPDDRLLLTLRFPMTFSLTSRVIRGELRSLNPKSSPKYFDSVRILSQLSKSSQYEFTSQKLFAKSCEPYPFKDEVLSSGIEFYNGSGFCQIIEEATQGQAFTVVPNWKCNGTDEFCSRLGPFSADESIRSTDGGFGDVKIFMQDIKCEQTGGQGNDPVSAKVATVFRVASPLENEYTSQGRTSPNNMTLAAEGFWKPSSGQLCMIGCRGVGDADGSRNCDSRVCLYVPISFSIRQRSIVIGSFSSLNDETPSFFPLSFEKLVQPTELWNYLKTSSPYYQYSKIDLAGAILERNEPFSFGSTIKKSLLQFPRLEDSGSYLDSLSLLAEDLTLHTSAPGKLVPRSTRLPILYMQMDIVSLGPLFGRFWSSINGSVSIIESGNEESYHTKSVYTEKQLLLNVSTQLSFTPKQQLPDSSRNFSTIYLEGLYDPHVGKMYLVGCRDIRASWKVLFDSMDLEASMDCSIEVVISYPPTTSRWLIAPTVSISIASQRTVDDPLYSGTVNLRTFPILYRQQREDMLSREGVEGILRILTLSIAIASIFSQLLYTNNETDSVPYVSVVMLGIQALGYSLPLIIGAEAVFKKMSRKSIDLPTYSLEKSQWIDVIDYVVKLLVLVAFLLTLRIIQRVRKSRGESLNRAPSEKPVLLASLGVHVIGFVVVIIIHAMKSSPNSGSLQSEGFVMSVGVSHESRVWEVKLKEYVGLVHDLFLLPQVIGNFVWQIDGRPLTKAYYIGITVVRLLPHCYDYITSSLSNPYITEVHEFVDPSTDFFTRFSDVAIPLTVTLLAIMVFIQQRWSYERISRALRFGKFGILPFYSRAYQRLSSTSAESELVSGVDRGRTKLEDDDDDDDGDNHVE